MSRCELTYLLKVENDSKEEPCYSQNYALDNQCGILAELVYYRYLLGRNLCYEYGL